MCNLLLSAENESFKSSLEEIETEMSLNETLDMADERVFHFNSQKAVCLDRDHFEPQGALLHFTVTERDYRGSHFRSFYKD